LRQTDRAHGLDALDGEVDQERASEIEHGKEIEVGREAQIVGYGRRDETPDQITCDVPRDVGRECAAGIHRAALLAQIGKSECKGRGYAEALHDAKNGEGGKVRRDRKQACWDRKQKEACQNAHPAVDVRTDGSDQQSCDCHADGAGIDGKAHRSRRYAVVPRQRWQDRLSCEQVDHRQECGETDHQGSQHHLR
jgi:hypothetical protein